MATHIPFDFCDDCGQRFNIDEMVVVEDFYFCEECYGDGLWRTDLDERDAEDASRRADAREGFDE